MGLSIEKAKAKFQRQLASAGESYKDAADAMTENPAEKAIANRQGYLQGVLDGVDKWVAKLSKITLEGIRSAMKNKGAARLTAMAAEAAAKWEAAMRPFWYGAIQQLKSSVRAMPNVTEADRDMRANAWRDGMRALGRQQYSR